MACCNHHGQYCWYDPCCSNCPELERCRLRWEGSWGVLRCQLPVSEHEFPNSTEAEHHLWTTYVPCRKRGRTGRRCSRQINHDGPHHISKKL